jgi:iron(III) transport system permease protein
MTLILSGPDSQVIAVTLFDLWNNGQLGELAAMGLLWTGIMTVLSILFFFSTRRYGVTVH